MLIRFIAKNLYSFKDETEFNLLPNKTQRLIHHRRTHEHIDFLRLSAIYGASGSGKSNLIKGVRTLEKMIVLGKICSNIDIQDMKFKLDVDSLNAPISIGIEFLANGIYYFYTITFDYGVILNEELYQSRKENDVLIFSRSYKDDKQIINFFEGYSDNDKHKLFIEVLSDKLVKKDEVLLTFLKDKYGSEFPDTINVYDWFDKTLVVIKPDAKPGGLAHLLDKSKELFHFANNLIPTLNTGVSKLVIQKKKFNEFVNEIEFKSSHEVIRKLKDDPNSISLFKDLETGEEVSVVYEDGDIISKSLVPFHKNKNGVDVEFNLRMESDGTKRLIEYLPALNGIINEESVYLIDEIERSIHPVTIKDILTKISLDEKAKGQLIFTTHESCLLDQNILRPDEIWFAQKDINNASKLYPLSDYNIHHTANIENGYLNGRYGGIPFTSNLRDLNWHENELSD